MWLGFFSPGLVSPRPLSALLARLQPVGEFVLQALLWVLYAVTYVAFLFLTPLIDFLRSLPGHPATTPLVTLNPFEDLLKDSQTASAGLAAWVELLLRGLLIAAALLVIGLLFAWALRRFTSTNNEGVRESGN